MYKRSRPNPYCLTRQPVKHKLNLDQSQPVKHKFKSAAASERQIGFASAAVVKCKFKSRDA
jgi:hypothetical protein